MMKVALLLINIKAISMSLPSSTIATGDENSDEKQHLPFGSQDFI